MKILYKLVIFLFISCQHLISHADINMIQESHFPIGLSFKLNAANKTLSTEIVNHGKIVLIVDMLAVESLQLVYWFTIEGNVISSGYQTSDIQDITSDNFRKKLNTLSKRFIRMLPGEMLRREIPLNDLLDTLRPFFVKFSDNDFVGIQVFATGIAIGSIEDGEYSFKENLYRTILAAEPCAVTRKEIQEMFKVQ